MLIARDVWFGYDEAKPVLRGISLTVPAGASVGILGPNGSGKTTLLRLLAGTRRPQRGDVAIDGAALLHFSRAALARRMAVVPQETQLAFDYTVAEVAMMGRYPHLGAFEIEGPRDVAVIEETLRSTGTLHLKHRAFATLSGGEKQRVVIAAALAQIFRLKAEATGVHGDEAAATKAHGDDTEATEPSTYLLLDEPTASLDLGYQLDVADLLNGLHRSRRVGIVISTHDLGLAATLCERLLLVRDGAAVADGATDDVLTPDNIRRLYGVEAEVVRHPSGHRLVVPVRRADGSGRPERESKGASERGGESEGGSPSDRQ
jgi:iron complex transport system ATP-binding protein